MTFSGELSLLFSLLAEMARSHILETEPAFLLDAVSNKLAPVLNAGQIVM